ncbi:UNVERIFIED_CONTAM: hypothetical protein HDU68_000420 [Siphonaria sp. JEL0065]|nr:hypothetical protein HDU68_000420 [Siphonaria sp. JEL0065]
MRPSSLFVIVSILTCAYTQSTTEAFNAGDNVPVGNIQQQSSSSQPASVPNPDPIVLPPVPNRAVAAPWNVTMTINQQQQTKRNEAMAPAASITSIAAGGKAHALQDTSTSTVHATSNAVSNVFVVSVAVAAALLI